jgi:predicted transcriptional regulator
MTTRQLRQRHTRHTADSDVLSRQLDAIAVAIERARTFEHEQSLSSGRSRRLPADMLRSLRRWQSVTSAARVPATLCDKSRATAPRDNGQPTAGDQVHIVCEEQPTVPAGPATSVRIPPKLREQADALARERRWTFGEVVRVGLERLVAYDQDDDDTQPRRAA